MSKYHRFLKPKKSKSTNIYHSGLIKFKPQLKWQYIRKTNARIISPDTKLEKSLPLTEQMPEFPGGQAEMMKYLQKNLRYPLAARENGIQGTVAVRFMVDKDGSIDNVEVLHGIGGGCDQEVVRIVKSMPTWKPGKQNGQPVKVYFTLPFKFKLE